MKGENAGGVLKIYGIIPYMDKFKFIYLFIYFTFPWPENIGQYGGRGAVASHGSKQKQSKNK